MSRRQSWVPVPSASALVGIIVAFLGYLLPWFRRPQAEWWVSGWAYITDSKGPGWSLWVLVFFVLAFLGTLWAKLVREVAIVALAAVVATLVLVVLLVAGSFSIVGDVTFVSDVAGMPFGLGIPAMALGFGLAVAGTAGATSAARS